MRGVLIALLVLLSSSLTFANETSSEISSLSGLLDKIKQFEKHENAVFKERVERFTTEGKAK